MLHAQDVDYRSNCLNLVRCLGAVKTWSDAHPTHAPIAILLELKDEAIPVVPSPPAVTPIPWTSANIASIDNEINSVFAPSDIVRPDDVRGSHGTVNAGALAGNWPTLAQSRGKVLFLMDNSSKRADYLSAFPGLHGADIFTNAQPGDPDAAFVEMNDPTGPNTAKIQDLVRSGYVVRTRADGDTVEARNNDTSTRDAAFASGAQWVSTDFAGAGSAAYLGSNYSVELPSGTTARCDPVNAPSRLCGRTAGHGSGRTAATRVAGHTLGDDACGHHAGRCRVGQLCGRRRRARPARAQRRPPRSAPSRTTPADRFRPTGSGRGIGRQPVGVGQVATPANCALYRSA